MKYICIFSGSNAKASLKYQKEAELLGKAIVSKGYGLVYGGSKSGIMRMVAESVKRAGGEVIGVITPDIIKLGAVDYALGVTLIEEKDFAARKATMSKLADAFIALPGGYGTFDEITEVTVHNQFKLYNNEPKSMKPVCVLNADGFFDGTIQQIKRAHEEEFISNAHSELMFFSNDPEAIVQHIVKCAESKEDHSNEKELEPKQALFQADVTSGYDFSVFRHKHNAVPTRPQTETGYDFSVFVNVDGAVKAPSQ